MHDLLRQVDFQLLEPLRLCAPRLLRSAFPGPRLGSTAGSSTEFMEYRPYQPGDDVRSIDWPVYARLRQRFVRQQQAEAHLTVHLLLDTSQSMLAGQPTKLQCAQHLVAALSYVGLRQLDRVGLATFAADLQPVLWPQRWPQQLSRLLEKLAVVSPGGVSDLQRAFTAYAAQTPSAGALCIVSDFFSPGGYEAGLQALLAKKFTITLLHVLDDEEIQPRGTGSVLLRDLEDEAPLEVTLTPDFLRQYRRDMQGFINRLRTYCQHRSLTYVPVRSTDSFAACVQRLTTARVWQRQY